MPDISYLEPYHHLPLNEVVIPGAHDAGIYVGDRRFVKTQGINIAGQANAGCRFFDMRIATQREGKGSAATYSHKAYHLGDALVGKSAVKDKVGITSHQSVSSRGGGWGDSLENMLRQAAAFVDANGSEFLILKFSKCFNWGSIAEACLRELKGYHYDGGGNLNQKTCGELKGKVITVFDDEPKARAELNPLIARLGPKDAKPIMFIKNLYNSDTGRSWGYDDQYPGIQYFGKFSNTDKVAKNTTKQQSILTQGAATDIDCLGMMYWTATSQIGFGLFDSIEKRNKKMWETTNVKALQDTWKMGLEAAITSRLGRETSALLATAMSGGGALGGRLKSFMPNIVMMDFITKDKCDTIDKLNNIAGTSLARLMIDAGPVPLGPQVLTDPTQTFTRLSQYG